MKKIPLTQGQFALVDDADFDWLNQWKWTAQKRPTGLWHAARREGRKRYVYMHRQILGLTEPRIRTDHQDGNEFASPNFA